MDILYINNKCKNLLKAVYLALTISWMATFPCYLYIELIFVGITEPYMSIFAFVTLVTSFIVSHYFIKEVIVYDDNNTEVETMRSKVFNGIRQKILITHFLFMTVVMLSILLDTSPFFSDRVTKIAVTVLLFVISVITAVTYRSIAKNYDAEMEKRIETKEEEPLRHVSVILFKEYAKTNVCFMIYISLFSALLLTGFESIIIYAIFIFPVLSVTSYLNLDSEYTRTKFRIAFNFTNDLYPYHIISYLIMSIMTITIKFILSLSDLFPDNRPFYMIPLLIALLGLLLSIEIVIFGRNTIRKGYKRCLQSWRD